MLKKSNGIPVKYYQPGIGRQRYWFTFAWLLFMIIVAGMTVSCSFAIGLLTSSPVDTWLQYRLIAR